MILNIPENLRKTSKKLRGWQGRECAVISEEFSGEWCAMGPYITIRFPDQQSPEYEIAKKDWLC